MARKIILWVSIVIALVGWPISLIINPPKINTRLIFQLNDAEAEKKLLLQKLGFSVSLVKKIYYNNKTTIVSTRYTKNVLSLVNFNNYFFAGFPQVDVSEVNHRAKFVYPMLVGFLVGIYISIKKKIRKKLWIAGMLMVLIVSLFKKVDGWDTLLFPVIGIITLDGLKEIYKHKYGWILLLLISAIGLLEVGRMFV